MVVTGTEVEVGFAGTVVVEAPGAAVDEVVGSTEVGELVGELVVEELLVLSPSAA